MRMRRRRSTIRRRRGFMRLRAVKSRRRRGRGVRALRIGYRL